MSRPARSPLGSKRGSGRLGTFAGVFTPSVLTILGIILFRRPGYVVGSAGLGRALLIIALAHTLSILTRIDVWWRDGAVGHLSILLAHLLTRTADREGASIRIVALRKRERGRPARARKPAAEQHPEAPPAPAPPD